MSGKWFDFQGMAEAAARGDSADKLTPAQERAATLLVLTVMALGASLVVAGLYGMVSAVEAMTR